MSNISDQTKQELIIHTGNGGNTSSDGVLMTHSIQPISESNPSNGSGTSTTSSRSKPQACKVCGKILSSASSYYVHMKLHSGTKPYRCGVS